MVRKSQVCHISGVYLVQLLRFASVGFFAASAAAWSRKRIYAMRNFYYKLFPNRRWLGANLALMGSTSMSGAKNGTAVATRAVGKKILAGGETRADLNAAVLEAAMAATRSVKITKITVDGDNVKNAYTAKS